MNDESKLIMIMAKRNKKKINGKKKNFSLFLKQKLIIKKFDKWICEYIYICGERLYVAFL